MSIARTATGILCIFTMVLGTGVVSGQTYPSKPIHFLTGTVGGNTDITARLIAQGISGPLGQPVIVENRSAVVLPVSGAKAPPDGYLIFIASGAVWLAPLMQDTPYDPVRDFSPITSAIGSSDLLVVHPSLPVKSVKELIALAKARPGELNYASGQIGGGSHLQAELFKSLAGVNIVRIPYQGTTGGLTALIGGDVQVMFAGATAVQPHLKTGKLKALGIASAQPSARYPGLPTVASSLPGYEMEQISVIFAPAKTPATIITRLNQEIIRVLKQADVEEKIANTGSDVVGSSPEQATAAIKADITRMGKVIKDAGIRAE